MCTAMLLLSQDTLRWYQDGCSLYARCITLFDKRSRHGATAAVATAATHSGGIIVAEGFTHVTMRIQNFESVQRR